MENKKIAFIGLGNMGEALLEGMLKTKVVKREDVIGSDLDKKKLQFISDKWQIFKVEDNQEAVKKAKVIILAVKPQIVKKVLEEMVPFLDSTKLVISLAAGITTGYIENLIGNISVIRLMPNILVKVKEGVITFCLGKYVSKEDERIISVIFAGVGKVIKVEENLMEAVTALSGSGPAYVFMVMEVLQAAGIEMGLSPEIAADLVKQTVFGSAKMVMEKRESLPSLRKKVASPGGTTEKALKILEKQDFQNIFMKAIKAAYDKAKELRK